MILYLNEFYDYSEQYERVTEKSLFHDDSGDTLAFSNSERYSRIT